MGNRLCKRKQDGVDGPKSPTPFDRIINRLHVSEFVHCASGSKVGPSMFLVFCKHSSFYGGGASKGDCNPKIVKGACGKRGQFKCDGVGGSEDWQNLLCAFSCLQNDTNRASSR